MRTYAPSSGLPASSDRPLLAVAEDAFRCGYAALLGRPNVGKSTLMNRLVGQKVSITSPKPQTTRHRIHGIKTTAEAQTIYVDTPGLQQVAGSAINRYMSRVSRAVMADVDVAVLVVRALQWTEADEAALHQLETVEAPVVLAINQVDRVRDKLLLLPYMQRFQGRYPFRHLVPVSATRGDNLGVLEECVKGLLPSSPPLYPAGQVTDRSERFLAAELVREKLTRALGEELPYALTVELEGFAERGGVRFVRALIWVERPGQKAIVIGKQGARLKEVGGLAREEMQDLFGGRVFLELWVKVREGWSGDERALRSLGYDEA